MRTISEIMKEIQEEEQRAASKVKELQEKQIENKRFLNEVNEQYLGALASGADDSEIAILQEQLEQAERTVKITEDTIKALSNGNPRIQQLEAERYTLLISERKDLANDATAIYESLKQHHDALVKGVEELNQLYHKWNGYGYSINNILQQFNSKQKENMGLPSVAESVYKNPVTKLLNALLVERHHAFKQ